MIQLIYMSVATHCYSQAELRHLLIEAQIKNAENSVTGVLVHHDGVFVQVLEGDEIDVMHTYNRIEHDPRHTQVRILECKHITKRAFGTWWMGFADPPKAIKLLKGFLPMNDLPELMTASPVRAAKMLGSGCNIGQTASLSEGNHIY